MLEEMLFPTLRGWLLGAGLLDLFDWWLGCLRTIAVGGTIFLSLE
jgi:hypothetical protein